MLERKNWVKFGDAQRYKPGDESMTAVSIEEIFIERIRAQPKTEAWGLALTILNLSAP